MKCPRCQQDNPAHARFCLGCGARLALACGSCGAELPLPSPQRGERDSFKFEATFSIKFAHARPKTPSPSKPSNDGDIHISGTAPEIGLLTVAEIMNAVDFPRTLAFIQTKRAGDPVRMMGYGESGPSTVANPTTRRSRPTRTTSQTPTRITTSRSTLK